MSSEKNSIGDGKSKDQLLVEIELLNKQLIEEKNKVKDYENNINKVENELKNIIEKQELFSVGSFEGIFIHENDIIIDVNDTFLRMLGYTKEELIGRNVFTIAHPKYREKIAIERAKSDLMQIEVEILRKDGSSYPVRAIGQTISIDGKDIRIVAIHDISEIKRIQQALIESENKFRALVENSPNYILILNKEGNIKYINYVLYQEKTENVLGKNVLQFIHPDYRQSFQESFIMAIKTMKPIQIELQDIRKRHTLSQFTPIIHSGKIEEVLLVTVDISHQKKIELELNENIKKFQRLSSASFDGIIVQSQGTILEANDTFANMFGYKVEDIVDKKSIFDIAHPDSHQTIKDNIKSHYEKPYEIIAVKADGSTIIVEVTGKSIQYKGKEARIAAIRDITKQKQAEKRIKESENRFRTLFENSPRPLLEENLSDVISYLNELNFRQISNFREYLDNNPDIIVNCINKIKSLNPNQAMLNLYGTTKKEYFENISKIYNDAAINNFKNVLIAIQKGNLDLNFESLFQSFTGSEHHVTIHMSVVPGHEEDLSRVIFSIIDMTDRINAEEERVKLQTLAERGKKLESLGVLAGGVAHDFNNLLMGIMGNASLALLELPLDEPVSELIQEIEKIAERASDLSQQMLAYSGRGKFLIKTSNLSLLIENCKDLLSIPSSKSISLDFQLNHKIPPVDVDVTQIQQILLNLTNNARDAIHKKKGKIIISTGVIDIGVEDLSNFYYYGDLKKGKYVYLKVNDNGKGIETEKIQQIFDPFYTTKFTGRGLGLAIVMGVVRGHNAAINVESNLGRETTFTILFPCSKEQILEEGKEENKTLLWRGEGVILICDDEASVLKVTKKMLERVGFTTLTASDGLEGVSIFKKNHSKIKLVLLDLTMPNLDGTAAFKEMQKINPKIPVLLASGYNEQELTSQFSSLGLSGFIQKPYTFRTLTAKLAKLLVV